MAGVIGDGQAPSFKQGGLALFQVEADSEGTAMETENDIAFAAHPLGVVGCSSRKCRIEERLGGAADIDDKGVGALDGERAEAGAETPRRFFVEGGKTELALLEGNACEVVRDGHGRGTTKVQYRAG